MSKLVWQLYNDNYDQHRSCQYAYLDQHYNRVNIKDMNIFYLHPDPYKAAAYHYDKHKVKMILEAAQMLCTAHRMYSLELYECDDIPYKKAHVNHPSTIWARQNLVKTIIGYMIT